MFIITVTYDDASLHRIYGPTYIYPHAADGRLQLSPEPVDCLTYEGAQAMFHTASDWLDDMVRDGDREGRSSTVTLRGPNGIFRSHTFSTGNRAPLSLAKPAHPNLFTNV